jgi:hypothetical protein
VSSDDLICEVVGLGEPREGILPLLASQLLRLHDGNIGIYIPLNIMLTVSVVI